MTKKKGKGVKKPKKDILKLDGDTIDFFQKLQLSPVRDSWWERLFLNHDACATSGRSYVKKAIHKTVRHDPPPPATMWTCAMPYIYV